MSGKTLSVILATSLALSVPTTVSADIKDVLIGGAIGAIITDQVHKNKQKKRSSATKRTSKKTSKRAYKSTAASLNSKYSRGERVQIQNNLNAHGYHVGTVDGVLGRKSRNAIALFQASRGEPQSGQLSVTQFAALTGGSGVGSNAGFTMNRSLARNEMAMLQQGLQRLGYYNGIIDGAPGPGTQGAMTAFLLNQNRTPQQTTNVQSLVLIGTASGMAIPPYLVQEANSQMAFGSGAGQFGTAGVQQNNLFGTPVVGYQQQQPLQQQQQLFGTPVAGQQQQQLFGAPATQGVQPQQVMPGTGLYGNGVQQPQVQANNGLYAATPAPQGTLQGQVVTTNTAPQTNNLFPQAQSQSVVEASAISNAQNGQAIVTPQVTQATQTAPALSDNINIVPVLDNQPAAAFDAQQETGTLDVIGLTGG